MPAGIDVASALFWGVITFSILIVIHEGGHFLAARAFGVKVHEFMVGLPAPALRIKGKKTTYGVTMLPLGGYVRIAGMEPGDEDPALALALKSIAIAGRVDTASLSRLLGIDRERSQAILLTLSDWGALEPAEDDEISYLPTYTADSSTDETALLAEIRSHTYKGLSTLKRITVLAMGVIVNLVTAILIFTVVLSIWGIDVPSLTVSGVQPGSPAEKVGIQKGDTITSVAGKQIGDWYALVNMLAIRPAGETVPITYTRDGQEITSQITLAASPDTGAAYLGIQAGGVEHLNLNVWQAARESLQWTADTFAMIMAFFNPQTFKLVAKNARSIVGVSVEAAQVVKYGKALGYAQFIALLSLSLGIMNILPIPPLDGGKVAIEIIERVGGRPLGRKVQYGLSIAGAVLLFSLIGYLMYADVLRYFVNA